MYGIMEVYDVVYGAKACHENSIDLQVSKDKTTAMDELQLAVHTLTNTGACFAAVYIVTTS